LFCLRFWPAAGAQRVGEVKFGGDALGPFGGAQRAVAPDGKLDRGFFGGALGGKAKRVRDRFPSTPLLPP